MWQNILKKPFGILDTRGENRYSPSIDTYDEVFQGFQIEGESKYWTFSFDEAVEYAFFGSKMDTDKPRDEGKPKVLRAIPSKKLYYLLTDDEYGEGLGRGIEPENDLGRDYFRDATKKRVPDKKVIRAMLKIIDSGKFSGVTGASNDNAEEHFNTMLNYFSSGYSTIHE